MSSTPGPFALVPFGQQVTSGSTFPQQGSIDWVALGQAQLSASVAILGRLSSAGVEPLTVAVGQAICSKIPLGIHGEKVLSEAMASLKAFSSSGDLIWFGVGVRHILRVLVQSSQGASLVALCAALCEGHTVPTSALVMFEMAKRCGSPNELSPSFAQWQALMKVCSSVFCHTTLGIRTEQMLKLSGCGDGWDLRNCAGHPQDMADIILAIGDVAAGDLLAIDIMGGPSCSWVAAFADFVLGLRVAVIGRDGNVLSTNFDVFADKAQVHIKFNESYKDSLACVGRVFYLRRGDDYIYQCLYRIEPDPGGRKIRDPFLGGRVSWNTMLCETFGEDATNLLQLLPEHAKHNRASVKQDSAFDTTCPSKSVIPMDEALVRLFIAGAAFYTGLTVEAARYANIQEFIHSATTSIPELAPLRARLLQAADRTLLATASSWEIEKEFSSARGLLAVHCHGSSDLYHSGNTGVYCLVGVAETCLFLSYLMGRSHLDLPLNPRRLGILTLYKDLKECRDSHLQKTYPDVRNRSIKGTSRVMVHLIDFMEHLRPFSAYVVLFSGQQARLPLRTPASAISNGTIYCFVDNVRELSDRYERASVVHLGAGSIQVGDRLHHTIYDEETYDCFREIAYQTITTNPGTYNEISTTLSQDTTTPDLQVEAIVSDSVSLSFWYRLSSKRGEIRLSPGSFVTGYLARAVEYKIKMRQGPALDEIQGSEGDLMVTIARGEGPLGHRSSRNGNIIIRPHCGNSLGRCAALVTSKVPVAMLNTMNDVEDFIRVFGSENSPLKSEKTWTLI